MITQLFGPHIAPYCPASPCIALALHRPSREVLNGSLKASHMQTGAAELKHPDNRRDRIVSDTWHEVRQSLSQSLGMALSFLVLATLVTTRASTKGQGAWTKIHLCIQDSIC